MPDAKFVAQLTHYFTNVVEAPKSEARILQLADKYATNKGALYVALKKKFGKRCPKLPAASGSVALLRKKAATKPPLPPRTPREAILRISGRLSRSRSRRSPPLATRPCRTRSVRARSLRAVATAHTFASTAGNASRVVTTSSLQEDVRSASSILVGIRAVLRQCGTDPIICNTIVATVGGIVAAAIILTHEMVAARFATSLQGP